MAQKQQNNAPEADALLPIMAQAVLSGETNDTLKELLNGLLGDMLERRKKEQALKQRRALSAIQAAKEAEETQAREQANCNHLKQDDTTRLHGQYLTGTGQLALVCSFCGKNYHLPALEGQEAPPRQLIPPMDQIGG